MAAFMSRTLTASYGQCLNNIKGDDQFEDFDKDPTRMDSKMTLISQHPFHLAMESAVEPGWVTEKIFQVDAHDSRCITLFLCWVLCVGVVCRHCACLLWGL